MDKRDLSSSFKKRLAQVLASHPAGKGQFLKATGIDRSALSQFLNPDSDRLPRAETLRRIARVSGVSVDWLLCLENAPEGRQEVAESVQIEKAVQADGSTPLDRWRSEASGFKLRYVPSTLPDMVSLSPEPNVEVTDARGGGVENVLGQISLEDMDVEIAMPVQTLQDLSGRSGLWRDAEASECRAQLAYMARVCRENYPALRLHLYDGTQIFSAPFTVFGKQRVALYIGDAYLVVSSPDQVRGFAKQFDRLVRRAIISSDRVHEMISDLASDVKG
ncbi:helix-turn-helix domain-containing protein [Roseobacter sp. YSTF-M11]|uniref:Helix-turn-helix domain-containing protein n=1 Tax=Roseobacter insulae TaxID=2859783 RepID=A0A9X1FSN8_9RHOB|nr:helix-turn-helix transcriptional regulator [Roseobacter insulae]MBW4706669.1 helix-turn-helix domain-containing protein [Roseobacter insulae]